MIVARIHNTSHPNTFAVSSGALRVTDPCYDMDTWCAGTLDGVKNGIWKAHVGYHEDDGWGTRVAYLHIVHDNAESHFDHMAEFDSTWVNSNITVGVDSGQAGFFDRALFEQVCNSPALKEHFYDEVCALTCDTEGQWGAHPVGCVSSSGYGDGSYDCLVRRDEEGKVIEAVILYVTEYEEEEEPDEEPESGD